jgi:DNA repair protein RecO (recombination protein O)
MNGQETEALILQTQDVGESDRLVIFHALSGGKLRGLAKGARRSRRRFVHALEPCSLVRLNYREKRSMIWIEACKLIEPHLGLREDVGRWSCGALMSEIILDLAPEGETHEELFVLLRRAMWEVAEERFPLNSVLLFVLRFMDRMGYMPLLTQCGMCGRKLGEDKRWGWDPARGVLVCSDHLRGEDGLLSVDLGTLRLVERVGSLPLDAIWRLRFAAARRMSLLRSLLAWVSHHTGKGIAAMRVMEQIRWN